MANLKNKILQTLRTEKNMEETFNSLSTSQENLLKNHSNPVFSNKDKNKILKQYTNLQNLGKSLYRYKALKENHFDTDGEKTDIENTVLKGGISYYKYVWRSENGDHTCDVCKSLDGKVFDFYDELPERPHPNCKCTVEILDEDEIEVEDNEDTEEPQSRKPAPQPAPKSPQPSPTPQKQEWIKPCNGPITSGYGKRVSPVPGASTYHNGWDIGVPIGTPVNTIADGKVIAVGPATGYGKWVVVDHGVINGTRVTSEYGHLSSWNVSYGQTVKQGQVIAKSGNTGYSSGPHLHITIREGAFPGKAQDPGRYIKF